MSPAPFLRTAALALVLGAGIAGCASGSRRTQASTQASEGGPPAALVAQARPIGRGARFQPPLAGRPLGVCTRELGPRAGVHVELFAANRVVLIAAGVGTKPPRTDSAGRIVRAGCYGELVTLDPTGLVLVRPGTRATMADLFRSWGQPLSARRLVSFPADRGGVVRVYVDGRLWHGSAVDVPLRRHGEIVLEVGPYVPPHPAYTFPPGT